MHLSLHMAANVGPRAQKELFHEHDTLLFVKGLSEFLQSSKNSCHVDSDCLCVHFLTLSWPSGTA